MRRRSERATGSWKTILGLLVAAVVVYTGIKVFPLYFLDSYFKDDLEVRGRASRGDEQSAERLRDAICRDAQRYRIPLQREDVKVETTPSGQRITADYAMPVDLPFYQPTLHFHHQYPEDKRAKTIVDYRTLSALGLLLGLFWFGKGFVIFWKYRVVADTPLVPIRSIAMGLVQIHGKAMGERTLLSPVTSVPCLLYKVDIERWAGDLRGSSGNWSAYLTDAAWVGFCLEDETGRVPVDPQGAEYDLEQTGQSEISKRPGLLPGHAWETEEPLTDGPGLPPSDSQLRSYVSRVAAGRRTALYQGADLSPDAPQGSERKESRRIIVPALRFLFGIFLARELGPLAGGFARSSGDYRLTEYCILPEQSYDITGTCTANPQSKDEADRQVIAKGKNAPLFLISNRIEKDIEGTLRARALRHILGGGLLAIGCLAALLETLGIL
ncbi:MAG: hypothetical protein LAO07_20170 [Acidobacteriia bacterium]|nr:hypothetical protein [Terriglobia bacterium]